MNVITTTEQRPRVGVGVMIFKDGKILLGKRKGAHGAGEYAFPGGHLEYMESFEECARREVSEECGIAISDVRFQFLANVKHYTPRHYIQVGIIANWTSGTPQVLEPDKSEEWQWYSIDALPRPTFAICHLFIQSYKTGCSCFDAQQVEDFFAKHPIL